MIQLYFIPLLNSNIVQIYLQVIELPASRPSLSSQPINE